MSRKLILSFIAEFTREAVGVGLQAAHHDFITGEVGKSTRTAAEAAAAFRQMVSGQPLETTQPTVTMGEVPQLPEAPASTTQTSVTEPRKGPGRPRKQLEPPK